MSCNIAVKTNKIMETTSHYWLSFGALTDVQYADHDDQPSWCSDACRYYRNSLNLVQKAFETWTKSSRPVRFALQLGDLIDALNTTLNNLDSHEALFKTLSVFAKFPSVPTYHVVGNHELYNFSREELVKLFCCPDVNDNKHAGQRFGREENQNHVTSTKAYFSFSPVPELLFIVLDCFDISILGYESTHPKLKAAEKCLEKYHSVDAEEKWKDDHLTGLEKRFVDYNGALGLEQLQWLDKELEKAKISNKKVIICDYLNFHH